MTRSLECTTARQGVRVFAGGALLSAALLTGCGMSSRGAGTSTGSGTVPVASGPKVLSGLVYGGQQPIAGATIQMYAMGTSGNASAATPLIAVPVLTDTGGNFNVGGLYTCPTGAQVYLTASGGDPQLRQGVPGSNAAIALMADLGDCATLKANAANTFLIVDEVTTVAAVYALGSFASDYTTVGYAAGNLTGAQNAYLTQNLLASVATGTAQSGAVVGVTLPATRLNALSDAIAACVNSSGPTSQGCSTLFTATGVGTGHQNTVAALAALAHSPGSNVASIFSIIAATPPFQPSLMAAPSDWTLPVIFTGGGLASPNGIAIDAAGDAWIANQGGNAVTEIARGGFASGQNGFASTAIAGPSALAIDTAGNVWVANTAANNVLELASTTGAILQTITTDMAAPNALAFDGTGNLWVTNFSGNSLARFNSNGNPVGVPITGTLLSAPVGLAVDASNTIWVTSSANGTLNSFNTSGSSTGTYTDGLMVAPGGVATDSAHNRVWTAATGISAVSGFTAGGATVSGEPFTTSGNTPLAVAVDGGGTVWTTSAVTAGSLSGFTYSGTAVTPTTGLGTLHQPVNLAVDNSGNVWVTSMGDNSVTEFVGLATAVTTPLVASGR